MSRGTKFGLEKGIFINSIDNKLYQVQERMARQEEAASRKRPFSCLDQLLHKVCAIIDFLHLPYAPVTVLLSGVKHPKRRFVLNFVSLIDLSCIRSEEGR